MMTDELDKILRREADKKLIKEAIKEAAKEWLDDQYRKFGRWSLWGIGAAATVLLVKILVNEGVWK